MSDRQEDEAAAQIEKVTQSELPPVAVIDHAEPAIPPSSESSQDGSRLAVEILPDSTSGPASAQDEQSESQTEAGVSDPDARIATHATEQRSDSDSKAAEQTEETPKLEAPEAHVESISPPTTPDADNVSGSVPDTASEEPTSYDPTPVIRGYVSVEEDNFQVERMSSHITTVLDNKTSPGHDSESVASAPMNMPPQSPAKHLVQPQQDLFDQESSHMGVPNLHEDTGVATEQATCNEDTKADRGDALAQRVRETWCLIFGSRYEDEDHDEASSPVPTSSKNTSFQKASDPVPKKHSKLRRKLNDTRVLAHKLVQPEDHHSAQPSVDHTKNFVVSAEALPTRNGRRGRSESWDKDDRPFERAGFNPTAVRFCIENAMITTIETMTKLHAIAQDEPEPSRSDLLVGLFLTQWELDVILNDLFPSAQSSSSELSASRLIFDNPEYAAVPFTTLLQVSWFLPFDQFSNIRSLVAQISRKHLSERKVALLDAALRRHFILRPYPGTRLQLMLLRMIQIVRDCNRTRDEGWRNNQVDDASQLETPGSPIIDDFLRAIHVRQPKGSYRMNIHEFLRLSPPDLALRFGLTSIITIQRVMFFRHLVERLTEEKCHSSRISRTLRSGNKVPTQNIRSDSGNVVKASNTEKSSSKMKKKTKRKLATDDRRDEDKSDAITDMSTLVESAVATHGSASPRREEVMEIVESSSRCDITCVHMHGTMKDTTNQATVELVKSQPWLLKENVEDELPAQAGTQATFIAAEAFQPPLSLLSSSHSSVPASLVERIQEFTPKLYELTAQKEYRDEPEPPPQYQETSQTGGITPLRPVPLPVQRSDTESKMFPPPYIPTGPAYWTFNPDLPEPATPSAKQKSAPRTVLKAKSPPGVGDYDVRHGDKWTFHQKPSYTFSKTGFEPVDEGEQRKKRTPTPKKSVQQKESIESTTSTDPPGYTRWASAALEEIPESSSRKNKSTTTSQAFSKDDDGDNDTSTIDQQIQDALRLQRSFVIDDMLQHLLSRPRPRPSSAIEKTPSRRTIPSPRPRARPTSARQPSRLVTRVREATGEALKANFCPVKKHETRPPPLYDPPALKQPPKDYEPPVDDAHLRWAARVSEFYKAKLNAAAPTRVSSRTTP